MIKNRMALVQLTDLVVKFDRRLHHHPSSGDQYGWTPHFWTSESDMAGRGEPPMVYGEPEAELWDFPRVSIFFWALCNASLTVCFPRKALSSSGWTVSYITSFMMSL